jgi:hypothetical protein
MLKESQKYFKPTLLISFENFAKKQVDGLPLIILN